MAKQRFSMRPVGYVQSPFRDRDEIPHGLGARHTTQGVLDVLPEFTAGLADIEGFSHLFVLWVFDRSERSSLVSHPPSDERPHGVFATRSPNRPNPIGLTIVKLLRREDNRLVVQGVDMLDGSPILDLKPVLSSVAEGELRRGWLAEAEARARRRNESS
jgi:tRNA-Thr(GGU) m(6)t(6)A37 methyltransferase TsaA